MSDFSRREFLVRSGTVVVGIGLGGGICPACKGNAGAEMMEDEDKDDVVVDSEQVDVPPSQGYILVDPLKCQGCTSCMLACSLVHEGVENPSLSRIQVVQNAFADWSNELSVEQCRQCVAPKCVEACKFEAARIDEGQGNVRIIDASKCVGCGRCFSACPHRPRRLVVTRGEGNGASIRSIKCDLCVNAPYHWDETGGGIGRKQACVEVCPLQAITFSNVVPDQTGDSGYKVDLRESSWAALGYPQD